MEQLYYILDLQNNDRVVENLTLEQANEWLEQNGIASIHVVTPY